MPSNAIAVSSWSLHRLLGISYRNGPGAPEPFACEPTWGEGEVGVIDLPAALAARGYTRCELCHFHVESLEPTFLNRLGAAFREAGVVLQTLLIDDGDLTNAATHQRDFSWIETWIGAAALLGAENARVIAGKARPTPETLGVSVAALKRLARTGASKGVRVVTENWFDLTSTPEAVHHILDGVGDELGFLADTGNWSGTTKYGDLRSIFARAELCHAKPAYLDGGNIDALEFGKCLDAADAVGYIGPHTLIYDASGIEWDGLAAERDVITARASR